jgi:hypothetical protein
VGFFVCVLEIYSVNAMLTPRKTNTMARKIIYIAQERKDLFPTSAKKNKDFIFHFPKEEMEIIKKLTISVLEVNYINISEEELEFRLQEKIMESGQQCFLVLTTKENENRIKRFMTQEMEGLPGLDIIPMEFLEISLQKKEDLFLSSKSGYIFPVYVNNTNYYAKNRIFQKRYEFKKPSLS